MDTVIKAFDHAAVHAGNRGLAIDHAQVRKQVDALLDSMDLAQVVNELSGRQLKPVDGLYEAGGDAALGIPTLRMVDGPRGARTGKATAFPVAMARGATFDVLLERRVGLAIGLEVAAKGGNVLLAPTINLLRHPGWGRAQETYSEDPHHMGAMAAAFVSGAQNHVLTSPKHLALNNLENTRFEMSGDIGLRALHEVYLPHFRRCVCEAAAASLMTAYNKVNGVYCGESTLLLDEILRKVWDFKGFVESDWFLGTRSTAASLVAGLDIEMPGPDHFSLDKVRAAIERGELTEEVLRRNAGRVLHQKLGWRLDDVDVPAAEVVESPAHVDLAREVSEKSLVLLKNAAELLPLQDRAGLEVAVLGDLADVANLGDRGSSYVSSSAVTTPLAGLQALAEHSTIRHLDADGDLTALAACDVTIVVAGLTYRDEGEFIPVAQQEAEEGELARGGDRDSLALPQRQLDLIQRAAEVSRRTIVVLQGGSAVLVDPWIDSVDAVVMAWYPGREGGHAIARALFGVVNAFGRLPVSLPASMDQLQPWDTSAMAVQHDLLHGYRYLDHHASEPAFPFGFGLSYTTFDLSGLDVQRQQDGFAVQVRVTNTGNRAGAAVPQLYLRCTASTVFRVDRELKGFGRVEVATGESAVVAFELADTDLQYFDEAAGAWHLEACTYEFLLGQSSRDLPLASTWTLDGGTWQRS